ncbi:MAG: PAS domain-containing protein [Candidatus Riflebacteria bacterium]|nr:PAS domain-containing protein [Candidatus Riflebacteria bacterium]
MRIEGQLQQDDKELSTESAEARQALRVNRGREVAAHIVASDGNKCAFPENDAEGKYRLIVEGIPNIVWSADPTGYFDYHNRFTFEYCGIPPQGVPGWKWTLAIHPDDASAALETWRHALEMQETCSFEHRIRRADGQYRWHLSRAVPQLDGMGRITRWVGTATDIHDMKTAGEDLSKWLKERVVDLTAEVRRLTDQLHALASELTQSEQGERKRIAALLHDHLQQLLVGAQMQLSRIKRDNSRSVQSATQEIEASLREALTTMRSLTVELCPPILYLSGLAEALSWLATHMKDKYKLNVNVFTGDGAEPASHEVRVFLFEAVREMLLNVLKHSGILEANLTMLKTKDNQCRIIIEDKGRGFYPTMLKPGSSGGIGLFSIQQRLMHLGGTLNIESAPGEGTKSILEIPITQHV